MSNLKKLKKLYISVLIMITAIILGSSSVNAVWFSGWKKGSNQLWTSREFYCIEHQDYFTAGNWNPINSWTINSDDPSHANRILANILYNGIKTGQGGYNCRGEYQMAVWKWYYMNGRVNTSYVDSPRYDLAYRETLNPTPYSNGKAGLSIADNQVTMEGNIGSIKINNVTGTVDNVEIIWKDPTNNKEYKKNITTGKSGENGWIEFYSDRACTKRVNINDFKKGTIYIKNLKEDYEIKNIKMHVKNNASGYSVTVTRWRKSTWQASQQDLISASMKEGTPSEVTIPLKVKYVYGNLRILKKGVYKLDGKSKEQDISASFKIYCPSVKKWVVGDANGNKTFVDSSDKATTYKSGTTVKKLLSSYKYQLVEVAVNNNYYNNPIKMVAVTSDLQKGLKVTKKDTYYASSNVIVYSNKTNTVTVTDERTAGDLKIIKADETHKDLLLKGAKFKIYCKDKGWLIKNSDNTYKYDGDIKSATEFVSNDKGEVQIKCLKFGSYYVYETATPEGYDITKQDGYENKNGKDPYSFSKDNKWVYLGEAKLDSSNNTVKYTYTNKKIVARLEGRVWLDNPAGKLNSYNDTDDTLPLEAENKTYDAEDWYIGSKKITKDEELEGIKVHLMDNEKEIAVTVTDEYGRYAFENLNYWDVARYYVEFEYDNTKYISVNPFVGNNLKVNSKAIEESMKIEELEDEKLTGTEGTLPGRAVTYKDGSLMKPQEILDNNAAKNKDLWKTPLTGYYDVKTFKIEDINLGIKEKLIPEYDITETLEYIKVNMNGYSYKYQHGQDPVTMSSYVLKAATQNSKATFSQALYPSDIRYLQENGTGLDVYVVYNITVSNLDTEYLDDIYTEKKLYLNSLQNTFDSNRYELSKDNGEDSSDFALWSTDGNGVASYDVNKGVYKDGIEKGKAITSRIQFKVQKQALIDMLDHYTNNPQNKEYLEVAPTVATADAFHEYLRTDNVWKDDANVKAYNGVKGKYEGKNKDNKKYYVHKSVSKTSKASDLYINLTLGESRKLEGKVFEDTVVNDTLGNGKLDENEKNRAKAVKVELLNADSEKSIAKLYQVDRISDYAVNLKDIVKANVTTAQDGKFTFDGVVPGYYYIRFTYSDGTQKMVDTNGNEVDDNITSKDYKSTIVGNDYIKESMKADETEIKNKQQELVKVYNSKDYKNDEAKKLLEWYKYLENEQYSTAVDDLDVRKTIDGYVYYNDGKITDGTSANNEVSDTMSIPAYTPILGISIENDKENVGTPENKNVYTGFNFGLIKQPDTVVQLSKKITDVKFTNQAGTTLVSGNPTSREATYVTALQVVEENNAKKAKTAKLEIEPDFIYGSNIEITYEISITNNSKVDYTEDSYYKYGEEGKTKKVVTVHEVQDMLDEKYNYNSLPQTTTQTSSSESKNSGVITLKPKTITETVEGVEKTTTYVEMTGWEKLASEESTETSYTVTALVANNNETDTNYNNDAKIRSLSVDELSTLTKTSEKVWDLDETTFTIMPTTGGNKNQTYWYVGAVALAVVASGIFLIKKKVL